MSERKTNDPTIIKRRIEACVTQAQVNAQNFGGDNATAAADLLCAFILLSVKSGASPEKTRDAIWGHLLAAVADFWPDAKLN